MKRRFPPCGKKWLFSATNAAWPGCPQNEQAGVFSVSASSFRNAKIGNALDGESDMVGGSANSRTNRS
jgi:hypothetical protein